jgi:hypothetical protein
VLRDFPELCGIGHITIMESLRCVKLVGMKTASASSRFVRRAVVTVAKVTTFAEQVRLSPRIQRLSLRMLRRRMISLPPGRKLVAIAGTPRYQLRAVFRWRIIGWMVLRGA